MSLLQQDIKTTLTDIHLKLIALLEKLGYLVEIEVEFPPKRVDCYLPELHVAFEADGPQHAMRADADRDAYLISRYGLPVYHLSSEDLNEDKLLNLIREVLDSTWKFTTVERRMIAWKAGAFNDYE